MKQETSILERLKVCWNVLTKKNYIYFGIGNEPIIWNEDGSYKELDKNELKSQSDVDATYILKTNDGNHTLHEFIWRVVEKLAKKAQAGNL